MTQHEYITHVHYTQLITEVLRFVTFVNDYKCRVTHQLFSLIRLLSTMRFNSNASPTNEVMI